MGLQLTKLVGGLLMPLPVVLVFMVLGIALLARKSRKRMGVVLLVLSLLMLSVVSGRGTAIVMAELARDLGVCAERIIINGRPLNTYQEALEVAKIVERGDTVILVTSASHMRRAVALFEGQGVDVIPSPTGHVAVNAIGALCFLGIAWRRMRSFGSKGR